MKFSSYTYMPVIRTRAAELRGLNEVSDQEMGGLLPLFELTRSRRSKKNPSASISLSVDSVKEIMGNRQFIADITSLESQTTQEIELLLDDADGFRNWTNFVSNSLGRNAIPVVHLTEPFDDNNFCAQVSNLLRTQSAVCLRISPSYSDARKVYDSAARVIPEGKLICVLDAGFVRPDSIEGAQAALIKLCKDAAVCNPALIFTACSSFPSSVTGNGYGGDSEGQFPLSEVIVSDAIKANFPGIKIAHGDYACIHPVDFKGTVTAWVPRIDVPLNDSLYYYRYRRNAGGYIAAAKAAIDDPRYQRLDCWAHENIKNAADGEPKGKSPSYWISVRVNYHLNRQLRRLSI